jgi:hypothetical protein
MEGKISVSSSSREGKGVPEGADILSKDTNIRVEKIENGYIISKNIEYKYQLDDRTDWAYVEKKYFSKTDPLEIKLNGKGLADDFK